MLNILYHIVITDVNINITTADHAQQKKHKLNFAAHLVHLSKAVLGLQWCLVCVGSAMVSGLCWVCNGVWSVLGLQWCRVCVGSATVSGLCWVCSGVGSVLGLQRCRVCDSAFCLEYEDMAEMYTSYICRFLFKFLLLLLNL